MKKNKKDTVYGCITATKKLLELVNNQAASLQNSVLCGVQYSTFFTPVNTVYKNDTEMLSFLKAQHIRFLGELLFENSFAYPEKFRGKIIYQQKKYHLLEGKKYEYILLRKQFQGGWVSQVFGNYPEVVGKRLGLFLKVDTHLRICDKEYRNIFFIQKNLTKESLATAFRLWHLHKFWAYALEKK